MFDILVWGGERYFQLPGLPLRSPLWETPPSLSILSNGNLCWPQLWGDSQAQHACTWQSKNQTFTPSPWFHLQFSGIEVTQVCNLLKLSLQIYRNVHWSLLVELLFVFIRTGQKILILGTPQMPLGKQVFLKSIVSLCHKNIAMFDFRSLYCKLRLHVAFDPWKGSLLV